MASRRTRIKGITNIPQRRKTVNSTTDAETASPAPSEIKSSEKNLDISDNSKPVPVAFITRKFIKPVLTQKSRIKSQGKLNLAEADSNSTQNNKIIILNEIISYPDQQQPVIIKNCGLVEHENHDLIKSSEDSNGGSVTSVEDDIRRLVPSSSICTTPTEVDYLIPPPSPNKINRGRIKAVPKFGQRNANHSASESEDESRRNYRHRNDSVCSSTSLAQDSSSISECFSPQKPKEFNSVIQRKCRRTEQSRKLAEARRDFYLKFGNNTPDRQKLTMIDLIFYNPVTNLMSGEGAKAKVTEVETEQEDEVKEQKVDDPKSGSDEENELPAPQIKIGPQGEIVVDEKSLMIENKKIKRNREEIEKSKLVKEDFHTTYGVYKKAKRSKDWSKEETLKFYKALNTIGTDFTLMCELFPRRSRRELKMKFKKEERINKALVDKAIMQPRGFDFQDFKHEVDMEEKELIEIEKQKEREKILKVEEKKKKKMLKEFDDETTERPKLKRRKELGILNVLGDDEDDNEDEEESEISEETSSLLSSFHRPTRSGRIPKVLEKYGASENTCSNDNARPGSLIVMASTSENGDPIYKVCMVTEQNTKTQVAEDMHSLEKALQYQGKGIENLFTLSAAEVETPVNDTPTSEVNITIPADEHNMETN